MVHGGYLVDFFARSFLSLAGPSSRKVSITARLLERCFAATAKSIASLSSCSFSLIRISMMEAIMCGLCKLCKFFLRFFLSEAESSPWTPQKPSN